MTFITLNSQLSFDNNHLNIKKVKQDPNKRYWFDSFILIAFFISFQIYRAITDEPIGWVIAGCALVWIYPHLERIFKILFVYHWGNRIALNKIKEIKVLPAGNELEDILCLKLINGRKKIFIFRKAENQLNDFVEALKQKTNPREHTVNA